MGDALCSQVRDHQSFELTCAFVKSGLDFVAQQQQCNAYIGTYSDLLEMGYLDNGMPSFSKTLDGRLWCKFVRGAQQSQWRGKDYAASTAFQIAGAVGFLRWKCPRPNCPLRIRRSSSIPAMVVAAQSKSLKPSIGPVRDLMPR
jgi:hypothetical protein